VHVDNDLVYEVAFHIVEKPAEVLDEIMEHQLDEFSLQFRGYHLKELVLFYNYVKVWVHRDGDVLVHREVEVRAHVFGLLAFLNKGEPNVELAKFVLEKRSEGRVSLDYIVYKVHQNDENNNASELNENRNHVLDLRAACVVAIPRSRNNSTNPVVGKYVELIPVVSLEHWCFYPPRLSLIPKQVLISYQEPNRNNKMGQNHEVEDVD
jgi:hypothetical protein